MLASTDSRFREYSLDGAVLYFDPRTGTSVRAQSEQTVARLRTAPRVVMFGITNACNLRCDFCSRDTERASLWTVESAFTVLKDLAAAGTLEVAFGGGEPFAFRGFPRLLGKLRRDTPLALHVTTNGTLLTQLLVMELVGVLGQVRLSIYENIEWRSSAAMLGAAGQLFGANVLAHDAALPGLPGLLAELTQFGCHDVSLLRYIGGDARLHLSPAGERRLESIISASPLPVRLSVCFGHRLSAPRLFDGADGSGDCGAGYDFISLTPDQRMHSCSFQDAGLPAATATEILAGWRTQAALLRRPSLRAGCARQQVRRDWRNEDSTHQLAVWQAFSGNNSGECCLVARFQNTDAADTYLAELMPGYEADAAYSAPWKELFRRERVDSPGLEHGEMPDSLVAIRRSVVARGYSAEDAFPELRALAWKRGAEVLPGGVHVHEGTTALFVARCKDRKDANGLADRLPHPQARTYLHGEYVFGVLLVKDACDDPGVHSRGWGLARDTRSTALANIKQAIESWAGERPVSFELYFAAVTESEFVQAKQTLGERAEHDARGVLWFYGDDAEAAAQRLARTLADEGKLTQVASTIMVEKPRSPKRLAVLGLRSGASFEYQYGAEASVVAHLAPPEKAVGRSRASSREPVDLEALARDLPTLLQTALLPERFTIKRVEPTWGGRGVVEIITEAPVRALPVLDAYARQHSYGLFLLVEEHRSLSIALKRLLMTCA